MTDSGPTEAPSGAPRLHYASLPPGSRLELREDAEGLSVLIPPNAFREVIWGALLGSFVFVIGIPLALLLVGIVIGGFRGVFEFGLSPWEAVTRLGRIPLQLWLQPFRILGKASLLIGGGWFLFTVIGWAASAKKMRTVRMTRSGRILYRLNESDLDPLWEVNAKDVVRIKRRGRTIWLRCRDRSWHRLDGRTAEVLWLAAALERFIREHAS